MKYSHYQKAVFSFAEHETGNAAINAVAGSGKTTTGVIMSEPLDMWGGGKFMAFNRHIADTLNQKLSGGFTAQTYNSFGNQILGKGHRLNKKKDFNILAYKIADRDPRAFAWGNTIVRLISLFKNMALFSVDEARGRLSEIVDRHDIDIPVNDDTFYDWLFETYEQSCNEHKIISYDDQKFLPLYLGLPVPVYPNLIVDEYQDTCNIESMLVRAAGERIFVFGDPDQCIYSFKGTTPDAMQVFIDETKATELPLSICYRCPKRVVQEAQRYVPRIEWAPGCKEGDVDSVAAKIYWDMAKQGDMILGRTTAEVVSSCLNFIRRGVTAYVEGREIGKNLKYLIEKVANGNTDKGDFFKSLQDYWAEKSAGLGENRLLALEDRVETVKALGEDASNVPEILAKVDEIFDGEGIQHMTMHKAKGLECDDNVFILNPQNIPHPRARQPWQREEELRLMYVAITRAKKGLFYVKIS